MKEQEVAQEGGKRQEKDREKEKEFYPLSYSPTLLDSLFVSSCLDVRLSLSCLIAIVRAQVSVTAGIFRETWDESTRQERCDKRYESAEGSERRSHFSTAPNGYWSLLNRRQLSLILF